MARVTLAQKMDSYRNLIFNSSDPQIMSGLATVGVDEAYLNMGQELFNTTLDLVNEQRKEYQEQSLAYDNFYIDKEEAEAIFSRTFKLVNVHAGTNQNLQDRLQLRANSRLIGGWIDDAIAFYNRLQNETEFVDTLTRFKLTSKRIEEELTVMLNLKKLYSEVLLEKGQAQEATSLRNKKMDELQEYSAKLKVMAELGLESTPQLLEKLGILVRS